MYKRNPSIDEEQLSKLHYSGDFKLIRLIKEFIHEERWAMLPGEFEWVLDLGYPVLVHPLVDGRRRGVGSAKQNFIVHLPCDRDSELVCSKCKKPVPAHVVFMAAAYERKR